MHIGIIHRNSTLFIDGLADNFSSRPVPDRPVSVRAPILGSYFPPETTVPEVGPAILKMPQTDRTFQLRWRVVNRFTWCRLVVTKVLPLLTGVISPKKEGI